MFKLASSLVVLLLSTYPAFALDSTWCTPKRSGEICEFHENGTSGGHPSCYCYYRDPTWTPAKEHERERLSRLEEIEFKEDCKNAKWVPNWLSWLPFCLR